MATILNPISPGPVTLPAHKVDRPMERKPIDKVLQSILADKDVNGLLSQTMSPQVIVGPRGVGKTALLKLTKKRASEAGIHVVELNKALLTGSVVHLRKKITPAGRLEKFNDFLKHFKGSVRFEDLFKLEIGPTGGLVPMDREAILAAGALAGPMALFLYEAHTVPAESMQEFCNAAQSLIGDGYPLALVMAGTPGLRQALRGIGATYMERSKFISLNLLAKEEAHEALSVPAADTWVPMDQDALESLVEWTECYPFFIQLAGEAVWDIAKGCGANQITLADVKQALGEAEQLRQEIYDERYDELVSGDLVPYALQVIDLIEGQPGRKIRSKKLLDGMQSANQGLERIRAVEIGKELMNLGFIYKQDL